MSVLKRVFLNRDGSINYTIEAPAEVTRSNNPESLGYIDTPQLPGLDEYWDYDLHQFVSIGSAPSPHHVFNYGLKEWVDPRSLDQVKDQHWAKLKRERDLLEYAGFIFEGQAYDSDQISQGRIVAAASLGVRLEWTLQDNSTVWLEPEQLKQLQIALAEHVTSVHARGKTARESIYAAQTKQEVEAVLL